MSRKAALTAVALLLACAKEPEVPLGSMGDDTGTRSSGGGGGGGSASLDAGKGGEDAGKPSEDAGVRAACDPRVQPGTCEAGTYCACAEPAGSGTQCFCFSGSLGEPCAAGAAQCRAPGICRWSSGFWWGRCGPADGRCGDVCELGAFYCAGGCSCQSGCAFGRCCQ